MPLQNYKYVDINISDKKELKKKTITGGSITLATKLILFFIQFVSTVVLARLLSPSDYGLVAMVTVVTGFGFLFGNLGLSAATIQRSSITHEQVSTLFWINSVVGFVLTAIVIAVIPLLTKFYGEPQLIPIGLVLSLEFFFYGLGVQHQALLSRCLSFTQISISQIFSTLGSTIIAIILAYIGLGYWSLVALTVSKVVLNRIFLFFLFPWIPGRPALNHSAIELVKFGSKVTGFSAIKYITGRFDKFLLGKFSGAYSLGVYDKAFRLLMMPMKGICVPINRVAVPVLSRLQNDSEEYQRYCIKITSIIAFITLPLVMLFFVFSDEIVFILLGEQWLEVGFLFKILALPAALQSIGSLKGMVLISLGKADLLLRWGIIQGVFKVLAVGIGIKWGMYGVAIAYSIMDVILFIPSIIVCFKDSSFSVSDFWRANVNALLATAVTCIMIMIGLSYLPPDYSKIYMALFGLSTGSVIYLFIFSLTPGGFRELRTYTNYMSKQVYQLVNKIRT